MICTDCIVCGGRRFLDERGRPDCEACGPTLADHVVSMRTDFGGNDDWMAVCPCGWEARFSRTDEGRQQREAAVIDHWRSVREIAA